MNRKYSTLFTMALLMAGSLGSVYAQTPFEDKYVGDEAKEVTNGAKYILVQTDGTTEVAFGLPIYNVDTKNASTGKIALSTDVDGWGADEYKKYVWTVSETSALGKTTVTFTNAAYGLTLYVANDGTSILTNYSSDKTNYSTEWAWTSGYKTLKKALADGESPLLLPGRATLSGLGNYFDLSTSVFAAATGSTNKVKLYKVKDVEASDAELNKLYNSNGFNFDLTTEGVENIFADQKIKAIKLDTDLYSYNPDGYVSGFPAGVYLAVSTPGYAFDGSSVDYLLNCEFIAVDPTENATSNANLRKEGQGFKFTTVSGKDLNLFIDTRTSAQTTYAAKMTSGAEISVKNACFTVTKNFDGDKYALSLGAVRYQQASGAAAHAEAAVKVNIMSDLNYVSGKTLATVTGDNAFIFKFSESTIESPANLLSKEGASIYNIQLIGDYEDGTYLSDLNGAFNAKGESLADVNSPAYQYMIVNVNGTNVTFKNRLSGQEFTAKLYKEENGYYSLNMTSTNVDVYDYNRNNNVINSWNTDMNGHYIRLIPATDTDAFAGYWNVDDETLVTLAFARDNTPTSNKLYPADVEVTTTISGVSTIVTALDDELTDDVTEAAQWQLVKDLDPTYKVQTYAYLDANSKVVYKTKGDTIAAYGYKMQLIQDGNPVNWYLQRNTVTDKYELAQWTATNTPSTFYISTNLDGSVYMRETINATNTLAVENRFNSPTNLDDEKDREIYYDYIDVQPYANDIRAYLIQDAPEISLPIESSFVSMESEMGNFVSMNEDQDGILASVDPCTLKVFATDSAKAVPSFYISLGKNEDGSRAFMFNPTDSVNYYVGAGAYDRNYQWAEGVNKVIFKDGILSETADTLTTSIKGKVANVAMDADRFGTQAGLNRFKFQIVKVDPSDDLYVVRQAGQYLQAINGKLTLGASTRALALYIDNTTAPTANEAIEAAGVQVIGGQGVVTVQGAAGKVVTVANILGQTIANQVAASDNVTIAVPAGIVVVAVDGEATKVVVK